MLRFRAIVAADVLWNSKALHCSLYHRDDIHRTDAPCCMGCQRLPRILIDQGQDPEGAAVLGLVFHEVPTPDMPWPLGLQPLCCGDSHSAGSLLTLADLETLLPPDPSHLLGVDLKAIPPKERRDPPVAVTGCFKLSSINSLRIRRLYTLSREER